MVLLSVGYLYVTAYENKNCLKVRIDPTDYIHVYVLGLGVYQYICTWIGYKINVIRE